MLNKIQILLIALAMIFTLGTTVLAQDSVDPLDRGWGFGLQFGFGSQPFAGFSVRYWGIEGFGFEITVLPSPRRSSGETSGLDLNIGARGMFTMRDDPYTDFYAFSGLAAGFSFTRAAEGAEILTDLDSLKLSGGTGLDWNLLPNIDLLSRVTTNFEYGLLWDLQDLLDVRLFGGGIGIHYYI